MDERIVAEAALAVFVLLLAVAAEVEARVHNRRRARRRAARRDAFLAEFDGKPCGPESTREARAAWFARVDDWGA